MKKHIIVTGGMGFLGSHLVEALLERDKYSKIAIVDNFTSNAIDRQTYKSNIRVDVINSDVSKLLSIFSPKNQVDEIYHLASHVGPAGVLSHSGNIAADAVNNAMTVARAAEFWDAKLVFVSSSEVYGGGQGGHCSEEMLLKIEADVSPRLEYAVGKLAAEVLIRNRAKKQRIDAVVVRPFNIAGARQSSDGGFVLPRFLEAAVTNQPITVFDDGKQIRAFTDVRDVAMGIILAMEKGKSGEVYNIGNEFNKVLIGKLAEQVKKITGSKSVIKLVDPKKLFGEFYVAANDKYPNSAKARDQLGWEPKHNIYEIVLSAWEAM